MSLHAGTHGRRKPLGLWRPERLGWQLTKIKLEHPANNVPLRSAGVEIRNPLVLLQCQTQSNRSHDQCRD